MNPPPQNETILQVKGWMLGILGAILAIVVPAMVGLIWNLSIGNLTKSIADLNATMKDLQTKADTLNTSVVVLSANTANQVTTMQNAIADINKRMEAANAERDKRREYVDTKIGGLSDRVTALERVPAGKVR